MDEVVLEIVRLPSGEYVMRRSGDEEALMTLKVSEEVSDNLLEKTEELARMMLVAGAHMLSDLSGEMPLEGEQVEQEIDIETIRPSVIH
jgi:dsDNA-binding SOS-regulon protein